MRNNINVCCMNDHMIASNSPKCVGQPTSMRSHVMHQSGMSWVKGKLLFLKIIQESFMSAHFCCRLHQCKVRPFRHWQRGSEDYCQLIPVLARMGNTDTFQAEHCWLPAGWQGQECEDSAGLCKGMPQVLSSQGQWRLEAFHRQQRHQADVGKIAACLLCSHPDRPDQWRLQDKGPQSDSSSRLETSSQCFANELGSSLWRHSKARRGSDRFPAETWGVWISLLRNQW